MNREKGSNQGMGQSKFYKALEGLHIVEPSVMVSVQSSEKEGEIEMKS